MTAQIHEILILNGVETSIAGEVPLPRPSSERRIVEAGEDDAPGPGILNSTACWRGYQGTWEIRNGRLYLVGLAGAFRLKSDGPIFADWVSGEFRVPEGPLAAYVHMGFESRFERERILSIANGLVIGERVFMFKPKP